MGDDFDVDQYRSSHESNHEWSLRRSFLLVHRDKFPLNRLLCLANCFVVVECYGCRYPAAVMRQLAELSVDIKDEINEHRSATKKRCEVLFVKASETSSDSSKKLPEKLELQQSSETVNKSHSAASGRLSSSGANGEPLSLKQL